MDQEDWRSFIPVVKLLGAFAALAFVMTVHGGLPEDTSTTARCIVLLAMACSFTVAATLAIKLLRSLKKRDDEPTAPEDDSE